MPKSINHWDSQLFMPPVCNKFLNNLPVPSLFTKWQQQLYDNLFFVWQMKKRFPAIPNSKWRRENSDRTLMVPYFAYLKSGSVNNYFGKEEIVIILTKGKLQFCGHPCHLSLEGKGDKSKHTATWIYWVLIPKISNCFLDFSSFYRMFVLFFLEFIASWYL